MSSDEAARPRRGRRPATRSAALVIRVFQLNGRLGAAGDALAKPAGQTTARWQVLAAIEDTPRTVADIARALGLARQSVQRVADLLADDGPRGLRGQPRASPGQAAAAHPGRRETTLARSRSASGPGRIGSASRSGRTDLERAAAILDRVMAALGSRRPG